MYADDFVVVCQTARQAQETLALVTRVLGGKLGLNRVIRGTANYFAPAFSTGRWKFQKLDLLIREDRCGREEVGGGRK